MSDGAKFCSECGASLQRDDAPAKAAAADGGSSSGCLGSVVILAVIVVAVMAMFRLGPFAPSAEGDAAQDAQGTAAVVLEDDIPDAAFRAYLEDNVDADSDGSLSREEVDAVTRLGSVGGDAGLSGLGISDLSGIELFTNLVSLVCSDNRISSLDLSQNVSLQEVSCENNQMTTLVLPSCDGLSTLHCTGNQLGALDLSGCPGLSDVRVDGDVPVSGAAFGDASARTAIEDMALVYSVAATPLSTSPQPQGELLVSPGQDPELDTSLIYDVVYPEVFQGRDNLSCTDITYDLSYEIPDVGGTYFVPEETGRRIISSFYGSCPDDLGYIGSNGVRSEGTGWAVEAATGPFSRTIESESWAAFGQMVTCDVTVTYVDGLYDPVAYGYRVMAVRDPQSVFGYHLTSLCALGARDAAGTGAGGAASGTSDDFDYAGYLYQELVAHGLVPDGTTAAVDSETDSTVTMHVYESHPDHLATLGWYTLDKDTLGITDDITGLSIY